MNMYLKLSRVALHNTYLYVLIGTETSVTRLGDLFHLRQLFKACGNNSFAHILGNIWKSVKNFIFLVKSFWATFIDIWRFFSGHTDQNHVSFNSLWYCGKMFCNIGPKGSWKMAKIYFSRHILKNVDLGVLTRRWLQPSTWSQNKERARSSVTRFGEISPLWQKLKGFGHFWRFIFALGKILNLLWQKKSNSVNFNCCTLSNIEQNIMPSGHTGEEVKEFRTV